MPANGSGQECYSNPSLQAKSDLGWLLQHSVAVIFFYYVLLICVQNEPAVKNTVVYVSVNIVWKKYHHFNNLISHAEDTIHKVALP